MDFEGKHSARVHSHHRVLEKPYGKWDFGPWEKTAGTWLLERGTPPTFFRGSPPQKNETSEHGVDTSIAPLVGIWTPTTLEGGGSPIHSHLEPAPNRSTPFPSAHGKEEPPVGLLFDCMGSERGFLFFFKKIIAPPRFGSQKCGE